MSDFTIPSFIADSEQQIHITIPSTQAQVQTTTNVYDGSPQTTSATDYALKFDGSQNYVKVADSQSLDFTGNFCVEATIQMAVASVANNAEIVKKNGQYILRFDGSGQKIQGIIWTSGQGIQILNGNTVLTTAKHHVGISYDGATFRILVDGTVDASLSATGTLSGTTALGIGADSVNPAEYFNGTIDEVRISNVARYTSSYSIPTNIFQSDANTAALWHFNEGSGSLALDSSGNGNTGTLTGSPLPSWVSGLVTAITDPLNYTYNQAGVTYGGLYNQNEDVTPMLSNALLDSPSLSLIVEPQFLDIILSNTQAKVLDQGYTYNQATFTYNHVLVDYGGLYNQNDDILPLTLTFTDTYTKKSTPSSNKNGPGWFMFVNLT